MFQPEDPLVPPKPAFEEPWHAQVLALAAAMVKAKIFTPGQWATALGNELKKAQANNAPDSDNTYYQAALSALEKLSQNEAGLESEELLQRKLAWERAYKNTPHGKPVLLSNSG
ncbi:MAG: nitrile hydratase accessory protein [Rhizobiaceae bacterium]|nr:nitrile hydratase accessory protein [Rhizobiaceae bacterium]